MSNFFQPLFVPPRTSHAPSRGWLPQARASSEAFASQILCLSGRMIAKPYGTEDALALRDAPPEGQVLARRGLTFLSLPLGILLSLSSCQKTSSFTLSETVYVRHQGADMPAYIHGNSEDKVFIIVLHGAGSFGLAFRDGAFTSELEKRYAVVYWDQRGQSMAQGRYSKPEDVVELMAEDVMALVAVLKHKYGEDIKLFGSLTNSVESLSLGYGSRTILRTSIELSRPSDSFCRS